jgi:predicted DsbA family dithiol-disulfide isomerase
MGLVDRLQQEFPLDVEWLGFEIHPETPAAGLPLTTMFPQIDPEAMTRRLNEMAAPFGLAFRKIAHIANSRLALEASEFAKDHGRFAVVHRQVFDAYFTKGCDIGDSNVLMQIARDTGMDATALQQDLDAGTYRSKLEQARREAGRLQVTAAPTFLFNNKERIVGAQPIDVFRKLLKTTQG